MKNLLLLAALIAASAHSEGIVHHNVDQYRKDATSLCKQHGPSKDHCDTIVPIIISCTDIIIQKDNEILGYPLGGNFSYMSQGTYTFYMNCIKLELKLKELR